MTAIVFLSVALAQPAPAVKWDFDILTLKNGSSFQGLLLSESKDGVRFQVVTRKTGRPTVTLTTIFTPQEVDTIQRLSDADRTLLKNRLSEIDPVGHGESGRMAALTLSKADWLGRKDAAQRYESDHFILISAANDEIVRRSAVRLEQLTAAMKRFFPPNHRGEPTTIYLAPTGDAYQALLGPLKILNPAVYDPAGKRILCGTEFRRLGQELTGSRIHHERQYQAIAKYEAEVRRLYKEKDQKADLDRFLAQAGAQRKKVLAAEAANDAAFDQATKQVFAVLYHEAFHAYIGTFVYPSNAQFPRSPGELPRWLNEGLAQIFESAIVEAGELRVDHLDLERAKQFQALRKSGRPMSLTELLRTDSTHFVAQHAAAKDQVDRSYVMAWSLAYDLLIRRQSIGTKAFDEYLTELRKGADPARAFESWIGQPLDEFERQWIEEMAKK